MLQIARSYLDPFAVFAGERSAATQLGTRDYNEVMLRAAPTPRGRSGSRHKKTSIYTVESTGMLIIALMILILALARYWHFIHWSLR